MRYKRKWMPASAMDNGARKRRAMIEKSVINVKNLENMMRFIMKIVLILKKSCNNQKSNHYNPHREGYRFRNSTSSGLVQ
ncbi:MAG: hypothetical protein GY699_07020 [Desulfobacteraceae bacterium]|nr:hypothetical protein [Desulfobacteraceae bacterium]